MGWVASVTPRPLYPRERPGTLCIGGFVGPIARLVDAEILATTRIQSLDRSARSWSLYQLDILIECVKFHALAYG